MDMSLKKNFKDPTVDHIDSNKLNNRLTNLRYLERVDNTRQGKHYTDTFNHHSLKPEDVHLICQLFSYGWTPKSLDETKIFNVTCETLRHIYNRKAWCWISKEYSWTIKRYSSVAGNPVTAGL